jgi:hypothetical protein
MAASRAALGQLERLADPFGVLGETDRVLVGLDGLSSVAAQLHLNGQQLFEQIALLLSGKPLEVVFDTWTAVDLPLPFECIAKLVNPTERIS